MSKSGSNVVKTVQETGEQIEHVEDVEESSSSASAGKQCGVVPESMATLKVNCVCSDGEIGIEAAKLQQSKIFSSWFNDCDIPKHPERLSNPEYNFLVSKVSKENMQLLVKWMDFHIGIPDPVVKEDDLTYARIWFEFTEEEKKFFSEIRADKLAELCEASNFLDIKSLYLYGCQELFRWMIEMVERGKIDKLRRMLIIDGKEMEPLTPEEEEKVRVKEVWCNY